ncbi:MAG TPA: hypothetical protein VF894_11010 [Anaeromyxobacter sp.]
MRTPLLHVVREWESPAPERDRVAGGTASGGDLVLVASVLALCLVPLVGLLAGGQWGEGTAGLAAAGALLAGRELAHGVLARRRR